MRRRIGLPLVALVVALSLGGRWILFLRNSEPVPGWAGGAVACRANPLAHVHHPTRLSLQAPCVSVSGTVEHVEIVEAFGDVKVSVRPDPRYRRFLRKANRGILIAAVIPPDQPFVSPPSVGEHATFYGAWVVDDAKDAVQLHPAWHIRSDDGPPSVPARPVLDVNLGTPPQISIGEALPVWATVTRSSGEGKQPDLVSEVRLFAELTSISNQGADWEAGLTNTRGSERLDFVALQIPGQYRITLYALKDGERGVAHANIKVRRR